MGATTVWERWDSMLPDGTINPGEMTSFNHYALGAVADWMHKAIGGIRPLEPGYARVPHRAAPGEGIDWAHDSLKTPHGIHPRGMVADGGGFRLEATVPDGVEADVVLPDGARHGVTGGTHLFDCALAPAPGYEVSR